MIGPAEIQANSLPELHHILEKWGASAPPRLERRGKQKELERFCLNRFLALYSQRLRFPLKVFECENPDFQIEMNSVLMGIEVVEACCPDEQKNWTQEARLAAKHESPVFTAHDVYYLTKREDFRRIVHTAIEAKARKASSLCHALIVYVNSLHDGYEDISWKVEALGPLPQAGSRFDRIWILSGNDLLCFGDEK